MASEIRGGRPLLPTLQVLPGQVNTHPPVASMVRAAMVEYPLLGDSMHGEGDR